MGTMKEEEKQGGDESVGASRSPRPFQAADSTFARSLDILTVGADNPVFTPLPIAIPIPIPTPINIPTNILEQPVAIMPTSHAASPPQPIAISQPADEVQAGDILGMDTSLRAAFEMIAHQREVMVQFLGDDLAWDGVLGGDDTRNVVGSGDSEKGARNSSDGAGGASRESQVQSPIERMRNVAWQQLLLSPLQQQEQQPRKPVCSAIYELKTSPTYNTFTTACTPLKARTIASSDNKSNQYAARTQRTFSEGERSTSRSCKLLTGPMTVKPPRRTGKGYLSCCSLLSS
jgi:hypothetical protein